MFEIKSKFVVVSAIIINAWVSHLSAVELVTEFYTAETKPKEYESGEGDCTVVAIKGWPTGTITITAEQQLIAKEISKNSMPSIKGRESLLVIGASGYIPGIPVRFTLQDSKNSLKKEITLIPYRIYAKSLSDAAQIEAKVIAIEPVTYAFEFEGFGKNEEVVILLSSYGEKIKEKIQINRSRSILFMPEVEGKRGGIARLCIKRPSGEILKLALPWGLEWIKYLQYFDKDGSIKTLIETELFQKQSPDIMEYFKAKR